MIICALHVGFLSFVSRVSVLLRQSSKRLAFVRQVRPTRMNHPREPYFYPFSFPLVTLHFGSYHTCSSSSTSSSSCPSLSPSFLPFFLLHQLSVAHSVSSFFQRRSVVVSETTRSTSPLHSSTSLCSLRRTTSPRLIATRFGQHQFGLITSPTDTHIPPITMSSSPPIAVASPVIAVDTKRKPSAVLGFMAGGIAACGAVTLTNPAEVCYLAKSTMHDMQHVP